MPDTETYDYVVIGAGIGGIFTGALLAKAGYRVCILEKHYHAGGYGHSFRRGDYTFCAELHYLWNCGPKDDGGRLFRYLGLEEEITFTPLNPDGFDHLNFPSMNYRVRKGFKKNLSCLSQMFPDEKAQLKKYFEVISAINGELLKLPLSQSVLTLLSTMWKYPKVIRYHRWTTRRLFENLGLSPRAQSILAGQSGNLLVSPNSASLLIHAGMVAGYDAGACVPARSYKHLFESLTDFIESQPGCKIFLKTEVKQLTTKGNKIKSAHTKKGGEFRARNFIFNGDPKLIGDLTRHTPIPKKLTKKLSYSYSPSNFTIYLGLRDLDLRQYGFGNWNVWHYSDDNINKAFDRQLVNKDMENPSLFISTPTLHHCREGIAPKNCEQMVICTLCDYDYISQIKRTGRKNYLREKTRISNLVLDQIERNYIPEIRNHIDVMVSGSPATNKRYVNAPRGNAYGADLTPQNIRPGKIDYRSHFKNLFFTGASAGVPSFAGGLHTSILLYEELTGNAVP